MLFVFRFSGPRSLTVIERVTETNLHDVKFLEVRPVSIPGVDGEFEVCRIGMSGTLAYELRGAVIWFPAEVCILPLGDIPKLREPGFPEIKTGTMQIGQVPSSLILEPHIEQYLSSSSVSDKESVSSREPIRGCAFTKGEVLPDGALFLTEAERIEAKVSYAFLFGIAEAVIPLPENRFEIISLSIVTKALLFTSLSQYKFSI
ncbi:hypothetical protein D5278_02290 [bacterium 1XD21-13]|nr:hypothetical protein [bacterium 1XD21-13]